VRAERKSELARFSYTRIPRFVIVTLLACLAAPSGASQLLADNAKRILADDTEQL